MCAPRSELRAVCGLALVVLTSGCWTNQRTGNTGEIRMGANGYVFSSGKSINWDINPGTEPIVLSEKGARVTVGDEPGPPCSLAGHVTGTAGTRDDALMADTMEALQARLPMKEAVVDARNQAGAAGLSRITIDGFGIVERHQMYKHGTFIAVYGRAWKCSEQ